MGIVHPCQDGCISYCWLCEAKELSINKYYCVLLCIFLLLLDYIDFNSYLCTEIYIIMKRYFYFLLSVCLASVISSCGSVDKTYGEQKEEERKVVSSFIDRQAVIVSGSDTLLKVGKINVITEEEFVLQDSTTSLEKNEYVLFANSGIYMQIVRQGVGKRIMSGESRRIACRFWEYNIMGDSIQLTNRIQKYAQNPEIMNISNNSGYIDGSFEYNTEMGSLMYKVYSDINVPDGWLKPLEYVKVGSQTGETQIAKVRIIVPHSSGHSHAMASVYPCFYELTFQER